MDTASYSGQQVAHSAMIDALCSADPEVKRKGFWKAVIALSDDPEEPIIRRRFVPDAFKLNRDTMEIEIHEVVRTNDLTERKLKAMGWLWGDFDCEPTDWYPVLYVHREGYSPRRIDLCPWYYNALTDAAGVVNSEQPA